MEASVNEIAVNFDLAIPLDRSTSSTKEVSSKTKNDNDNKFSSPITMSPSLPLISFW